MKILFLNSIICISLIHPPLYSMEATTPSSSTFQHHVIMTALSTAVATQFFVLGWLKKNNYLFGKKVMPVPSIAHIANKQIPVNAIYIFSIIFNIMLLPKLSKPASANTPGSLWALLAFLTGVSFMNIVYQRYLRTHSILKLKKPRSDAPLARDECPICFETMRKPAYICSDSRHLYCKQCLNQLINPRCPECTQQARTTPKAPSAKEFVKFTMKEYKFELIFLFVWRSYVFLSNSLAKSLADFLVASSHHHDI